ncbi:hypothetical protein DFH06DRAFT_1274689 [Mycena polygramma]|nr:hypothetical protein DFH06DRAFT_1274689 [Mycena polygramma]
MSESQPTPLDGRTAQRTLRILIIGGGIAGMAAAFCLGKAGHQITVVEAAPALGEVGAGIQVGPNMSRLLIRWGLAERLKEFGVKPLSVSFLRYSTGERVGFSFFGDKMEFEHGAPYYHLHRADLHSMLAEIAAPYMDLQLGCQIVSVDLDRVSATLASGKIINVDMIIGADGVKSTTRRTILGSDEPLPTGDVVHRAVIPTAKMTKDPLLRPLTSDPEVSCWMGPGGHIVGYCIRGKKEYNLVLLSPDRNSATALADVNDSVQRLLGLITTVMTGQLVIRKPLTTWLDSRKRIALIGDAAHPMLPYRAQGAAMALEDAAVLGNMFSRISDTDQIAPFLEAYEELRIGRCNSTQEDSLANRTIFHLPDGPAQMSRDVSMRQAMVETLQEGGDASNGRRGNPNMWADREKNVNQFSYDADEAVDRWWSGIDSITSRRMSSRLQLPAA